MAYTIEDKDIVINGWEEGIFDDPFKGIYDMRNVDNITVPGEVSIAMKTQATTVVATRGTVTNEIVTADYATSVFTHDGSETFTVGQQIRFSNSSGNKVFGGLTAGRVYFIESVPSPTTFKVSATPGGVAVILKDPSSRTGMFSFDYGTGAISGTSASTTIASLTLASSIGSLVQVLYVTNTAFPTGVASDGATWTLLKNKQVGTYRYSLWVCAIDGNATSTTVTATYAGSNTGIYQYNVIKHSLMPLAGVPLQTSDTNYVVNDASIISAGLTTTAKNSLFINFAYLSEAATDYSLDFPISNIGGQTWAPIMFGENLTCVLSSATIFDTTGATGDVTVTAENGGIDLSSIKKHGLLYEYAGWDDSGTIVVNSPEVMSEPAQLYTGLTLLNQYIYFCVDTNGRLWVYDTNNSYLGSTNTWLYMNNNTTDNFTGLSNVIVWKGYVFVFSSAGVAYTKLANYSTMVGSWDYDWQPALESSVSHMAIRAQDDKIYICNGSAVGRLNENAGFEFDPTDKTTFTFEDKALFIMDGDRANCLAELGSDLLIGGIDNFIYPWDRVSFAYNSVIRLSENFVSRMVTVNTTTYIFAGSKGRIFMTNGGNATPFYKIPDYLSNTVNPYINWKDATFNNNQLYFSFTATTNAGTTINEYGGIWAINVDASTPSYPRLQNRLSYNTYAGYASCFTQNRGTNIFTNPSANGYGLFAGWNSGSTIGIDANISTPYTSTEPYVVTDFIPVGQLKTKKTFENVEYKLSVPLVAGESVTLLYRTSLNESFVEVPITSGGATGDLSGLADSVNFENVQWIQLKAVLNGTATNPSYVRLRELRIR